MLYLIGLAHRAQTRHPGVEQANHIPFEIVERGIGLMPDDLSFDEAVRYLREHPELVKGKSTG
jgi:hypothetical protein